MAINSLELKLWDEYHKTKKVEVREKLIVKYLYLVKYIAGRMNVYSNASFDYDDIISFGIFGLIDAVEKFDVKKGVKFETYATLRIRGSIIDNMRQLDWVPRTLREKSKEFENTFKELEIEYGRPPEDKEVAAKMGISLKKYFKYLSDVNICSLISLEEYFEQNFKPSRKIASFKTDEMPQKHFELVELRNLLGGYIESLPEKEKIVISLYYYEELTLKEIGAILKVSESRVSQLHTKALLRLRGKLSEYVID
jgi:RNA polymerase sigma factor for flagellar operon FliA